MLNALRPGLQRLLTPAVRMLARAGVTPNQITVVGTLGVAGGALGLFPTGHLFAGTIVCTAFVFADTIDVFGGLVLWFFGGGHDSLLAGVALFCLVVGALVSYAKARAEGLGLRCDVGIAGHAEKLLISLVAAGLAGLGVPYVLAAGLWLLAAASLVTLGQRVLAVHHGIQAASRT